MYTSQTVTERLRYGGGALRRSDQIWREDRCVQTQARVLLLFPFLLGEKIPRNRFVIEVILDVVLVESSHCLYIESQRLYIGRRFTEMEITIVQFMSGSLWRVLKSCFSNSGLMIKILGLDNGTSLVLVISQPVIRLLYRHSKWIWFCNPFTFLCLFTKVAVPLFFFLCRREMEEELGIKLPKDAFEKIFVFLQEWFVC